MNKDQREEQENIYCMNYCYKQMMENIRLGDFHKARKFKQDMDLFFMELERMDRKKREEEKIAFLLKEIDGQRKIDLLVERYL